MNRIAGRTSAEVIRAVGYFVTGILLISHEAFAKVTVGSSINLSHFAKHALAMSFLAGLLHYALVVYGRASRGATLLVVGAAIFCYGLFIEYVQSFLPWRSAELIDLIADVVGIAIYVLGFLWISRHSFVRRGNLYRSIPFC